MIQHPRKPSNSKRFGMFEITSTFFQMITFGIAITSLILNIILLIVLNYGRGIVTEGLQNASDQTLALSDSQINYVFNINEIIPIKTDIPFNETIPIPVDFEVNQTFPIDIVVPFEDTFSVPFKGNVPIDTIIQIPINVPFIEETQLDLPIKTTIPVDLTIDVPLSTEVPIKTDIPVQIPIKTEVMVNIDRTIAIDTEVPIALAVPVNINLNETPFGGYLKQMGQSLIDLAEQLGN